MREFAETLDNYPTKIEGEFEWIGIVNKGATYKDPNTGEEKPFIGEDGRNYIGLLNESGGPLKTGEPVHFLWFARRSIEEIEFLKELESE